MERVDIVLRVASMSTSNRYYSIYIAADTGDVVCQCSGKPNELCSHIDAVLLCDETNMVHPDDRADVSAAKALYQGAISIPDSWKTSWQNNIEWRGLEAKRFGSKVIPNSGPLAAKMVCFTGTGPKPRNELRLEAKAAGWEVIDSPSARTTVLVCPSLDEVNRKTVAAKRAGTVIMDYEQWSRTILTGEVERPR